MLELLHEYRYLTPSLLSLAYGFRRNCVGRGYWHLLRELRRLYDAGLVERFPGPARPTRAGSSETIYSITHHGARLILDDSEYSEARRELYTRERKYRGNYSHHLAVATLRLILATGQFRWRLIDFKAEDRCPVACVRAKVNGRDVVAWPDAAVDIEIGEWGAKVKRRARYLFEIDLSRRNSERVSDRFLAYASWLRDRRNTLVVFVVDGEGEVERYLRLAGEAVAAHRLGTPQFLLWNRQDWFAHSTTRQGKFPWTLRPPVSLVANPSLATLSGGSRALVEGV